MMDTAAALLAYSLSGTDAARELELLRSELSALQGVRSDDIRAVVRDMLADADTRSSLQADDGCSGYLNGFFISSADGAFLLKLHGLTQVRWALGQRSDPGASSTGQASQARGFELPRARLGFEGTVVDASWTYAIAYEFAKSNSVESFGSADLSDAFVTKSLDEGLRVTAGQFRQPFSAEYALDITCLSFLEYSVVEAFFGAGYGQGIKLALDGDDLRTCLSFSNALDEANAPWNAASPESEWSVAARVEAKLAGVWRHFDTQQSPQGEGLALRAGGGVAVEQSDSASEDEVGAWTLDLTAEFGGANASVAYFGGWNSDSSGWLASAGLFVSHDLELVARFESIAPDAPGGDFSAMTVGLNHFLGPSVRLSVDFGYAFEPVDASIAPFAISNNWLEDAPGSDGQWVVRTQLSLSF